MLERRLGRFAKVDRRDSELRLDLARLETQRKPKEAINECSERGIKDKW